MEDKDIYFMGEALKEAEKAKDILEVPIGAVIVKDNIVIARGHNMVENKKSSLNHAEIIAIDEACKKVGDWRLNDCTMYVTLEPCAMCAGAIINSRIDRLIIGAMDKKRGCCGSIINIVDDGAFNHRVDLKTGVLEEECSNILKDFFKDLRASKN